MTLAPRRFPDTIARRRQAPGAFNDLGEWVPGAVDEVELAASVQPLALDDADVVAGSQLAERLRCYVPGADRLLAAFDDREADRVVIDGREFVVEESRSWRRSHTRATLLRQA